MTAVNNHNPYLQDQTTAKKQKWEKLTYTINRYDMKFEFQ